MKWLTGLLGVLFLASLMSLSTGCGGGGKATDIDASAKKVEHGPGHEQAIKDMKDMNKKPAGVR